MTLLAPPVKLIVLSLALQVECQDPRESRASQGVDTKELFNYTMLKDKELSASTLRGMAVSASASSPGGKMCNIHLSLLQARPGPILVFRILNSNLSAMMEYMCPFHSPDLQAKPKRPQMYL